MAGLCSCICRSVQRFTLQSCSHGGICIRIGSCSSTCLYQCRYIVVEIRLDSHSLPVSCLWPSGDLLAIAGKRLRFLPMRPLTRWVVVFKCHARLLLARWHTDTLRHLLWHNNG